MGFIRGARGRGRPRRRDGQLHRARDDAHRPDRSRDRHATPSRRRRLSRVRTPCRASACPPTWRRSPCCCAATRARGSPGRCIPSTAATSPRRSTSSSLRPAAPARSCCSWCCWCYGCRPMALRAGTALPRPVAPRPHAGAANRFGSRRRSGPSPAARPRRAGVPNRAGGRSSRASSAVTRPTPSQSECSSSRSSPRWASTSTSRARSATASTPRRHSCSARAASWCRSRS